MPEESVNEATAQVSVTKTEIIEPALTGNQEQVADKIFSLHGQELPADWPTILTPEEEQQRYADALYEPGEDQAQPPKLLANELSYTITSGEKELSVLAVDHIGGPTAKEHPQFPIVESNFAVLLLELK